MIKNILWDFDNTLAFRDGKWTATLRELLIKHGFKKEASQDISKYMKTGLPWHHYELEHQDIFLGKTWWEYIHSKITNILVDIKIPKDKQSSIVDGFKDTYLNVKKWNLYPDTFSALNRAHELGYKNYIFSNHVPELGSLVESLQLGTLIEKTITSGIIGSEKPNKLFFVKALTEISSSFDNCVMVGDNFKADISGAKNAGIKAVLVHSENTETYEYYSNDLLGIFPILEHFRHPPREKNVT